MYFSGEIVFSCYTCKNTFKTLFLARKIHYYKDYCYKEFFQSKHLRFVCTCEVE